MKTPEEIIKWCDTMLSLHPNAEDVNYFSAIKYCVSNSIPKGRWIESDEFDTVNYGGHVVHCSNCNSRQVGYSHFCCDCGADMRGIKNESI